MALGFLVLLVLVSPAAADPGTRAQAVIGALGVDQLTADKLFDVLFRYDLDLARFERRQIELKRRLVGTQRANLDETETLLDDLLDSQRALAQNEEQMIKRVRVIAGAKRTAQLLVLLAATEPERPEGYTGMPLPPPDQLVTPSPPCNPFESMHGCTRR
jgi:hypothetical protein